MRTVPVRLQLLTAEYTGPLDRARAATVKFAKDSTASLREFSREVDKAARADKLDKVASSAIGAGLAVGGAFALIVRSAANFDRAMDEVNAVTDVTVGELAKLETAAIAAGKATQYSATEAAKAEAELARAGLSTADILGGGLKGALALAAAGQIDLEEAAIVTAKALNTFSLSGDQAGHVADVLAAAANKSATNVHEMALATKMAGLVASQAGMSFEETSGALALFAQNGLAGSDGGTSLKVALMMLFNPTAKAKRLMDELGISVFDAAGNFVGLDQTADVLREQLKDLTVEQRGQALAQIFGADATRAANILYKEGGDRVREFTAAVNDNGAAARTAAQLTDNLAGDWERLTGALETFAIESGGGANEGLRGLTQGATALLEIVSSLDPAITSTIVLVGGLTAGALLLFGGMIKLRVSLMNTNAQLAAMGPMGAKAAAGLAMVARAAGKVGIAFAALQIIGMIADLFGRAEPEVDELTKSLYEFANSQKASGEMSRLFGDDLDRLRANFNFLRQGVDNAKTGAKLESYFGVDGFDFSVASRLEELEALDAALAQLASSGNVNSAKSAFEQISNLAKSQGVSVQTLTQLFPQYEAAIKSAATSSAKAAQGDRDRARGAALLAGALGDAAYEGQSFLEVFEAINNQAITFVEGQIKAEAALDNVADTFKENAKAIGKNGDALDINTEAGRANLSSILDSIQASAAAAQKKYEETGSIALATKEYEAYRLRLVETLRQQGLTQTQINTLISLYGQMPTFKATEITTPGLDAALVKAAKLLSLFNQLGSKVAAANAYSGGTPTSGRRWGGARDGSVQYAAAGSLRDAAVYAARGSTPLYGFAEPQTGGELFVPKIGNKARADRYLSIGAGWYGGRYTPAGGGGGGGTSITNNLTINSRGPSLTVGQLEHYQRQMDARQRVGRPG